MLTMITTVQSQFRAEIEAFLKAYSVPAGAFGLQCMNDAKFVPRMRAGYDVRASTIDRVRAWMADYRVNHPLAREAVAA